MKVILNIVNWSDKPVRLLQIFSDELSDRYNIELLITALFMNWLQKLCAKISSWFSESYYKTM